MTDSRTVEERPAPRVVGLRIGLQVILQENGHTRMTDEIAAEVFDVPANWRYLLRVDTDVTGSEGPWPAAIHKLTGPTIEFAPAEAPRR